ncbi:hypothetical protein [Oceanivirga salmonicida]|uniref:hypothetical protein n=1 Tax=Oceanivirga salmonicida TaxID=1769291 RepID=UPI0012E1B2E2|nr:hypothetical protein [Oceanivirga salmonicida]
MKKFIKKIFFMIILFILIFYMYRYICGDDSLQYYMGLNNMYIESSQIYSKKEYNIGGNLKINAYLKVIKPIKKEYFYKKRFNIDANTMAYPPNIVSEILLKPYVFNELIYDKNVGNDFKKVEEYILNEGSKDNIFLGRYKKNKKIFYKLLDIRLDFRHKLNKNEKIYCTVDECYEFENNRLKLLENHNYDLYEKSLKEEEYILKNNGKVEILKIEPEKYMEKFDIYPIIVISYDEKWELDEEFIEGIRNVFNDNMNLDKIGLIIENVDFHE